MKDYIGQIVDLRGDTRINPRGVAYGDGSGTHQRALNKITSIAIHHDATVRPHAYDSVARYRTEAEQHWSRLGPGLQYHLKIDNQGTIFWTRDFETWLYAVGSAENVSAINVCLDGYFHPPHNQEPTKEQYEALYQVCKWLCTQWPQFPATWPDVRPHQSYTATACAGDRLNPLIYPIVSDATAQQYLLNRGEYDWPELQPSAPPPPPPADTRPEWEKNFRSVDLQLWSEGTATVIDITNNQVLTTVADNTKLDIGGKTTVGGTDFYITKYWVSRNVFNKMIPSAQLKGTPDPVEPPPVPTTPPPPEVQNDHALNVETNAIVKQILEVVQWIKNFLLSIFNNKENK